MVLYPLEATFKDFKERFRCLEAHRKSCGRVRNLDCSLAMDANISTNDRNGNRNVQGYLHMVTSISLNVIMNIILRPIKSVWYYSCTRNMGPCCWHC